MRKIETSRILPYCISRYGGAIESDFNEYGMKATKIGLAKKTFSDKPTHLEKLVQRFRENGPDIVVPSEKYIASDVLDSMLAGKS